LRKKEFGRLPLIVGSARGIIAMSSVIEGGSMAIGLDSKQVVTFGELLMSQVVQQEGLTRLLVEKGVFSKEEFLEKVREVDHERKAERE
jgi:hypothetical protein